MEFASLAPELQANVTEPEVVRKPFLTRDLQKELCFVYMENHQVSLNFYCDFSKRLYEGP